MTLLVALCAYANKQLKSASTECREATGSCDLPEYCSGTDPLCPSDVYRRNTDSCTVDGVRQLFSRIHIKGGRKQAETMCLTVRILKRLNPIYTIINTLYFNVILA